MAATDPLKRALIQRLRFRSIDPAGATNGDEKAGDGVPRAAFLRSTYRPPDADFYCWKYGVWYNLMDCCHRHQRKTYPGCAGCGQGQGNLRQNRDQYFYLRLHKSSPYAR